MPEQNSGGPAPQEGREEPVGIREDWFRMLIAPDPSGPDSREIDGLIRKFAGHAHPSMKKLTLSYYLDWAVRGMVFGEDVIENPLFPIHTAKDGTKEVERQRLLIGIATGAVAEVWLSAHPESAFAREVLEKNINADQETQWGLLREMWPSILQILQEETEENGRPD